jgi:hypothetical protein
MSEDAENISIKIEVNEDDKTAVILIPWDRLVKMDGAKVMEWIVRAAKIRAEWEAKGYKIK